MKHFQVHSPITSLLTDWLKKTGMELGEVMNPRDQTEPGFSDAVTSQGKQMSPGDVYHRSEQPQTLLGKLVSVPAHVGVVGTTTRQPPSLQTGRAEGAEYPFCLLIV